nr:immunoglobulin light chain junction region [Macaca mulatta]MOX41896.1 immunoglobulin light chain junction region [Macaca mulatta]MOX42007.1 immunoglobulin light chain junction region [Macaca mulatta]MOX42015.1 immunoglobulin light chain junction region [Macaca mulatta]MOX42158.1 immunoglobulin light chain junction region [Macaca mulatta]
DYYCCSYAGFYTFVLF